MANPLIYHKQGWIEMICGCMFSGKTEELIRRVRTALIAKQKVQLFNSKIDTRYGIDSITSHNQNKVAATCVKKSEEILPLIEKDTQVVAIDEVNFLTPASWTCATSWPKPASASLWPGWTPTTAPNLLR